MRHGWLGAAIIGTPETPANGVARTAARSTTPIIEPLTDKETEVLRYLSALCSTEEIARAMFVSVNT